MPHALNRLTPAERATRRHKRRKAAAAHALVLDNWRIQRQQRQILRERFGTKTLKSNPKGVRSWPDREPKPARGRYAGYWETNKRYPLSEIRAARAAGRKLKPQNQAAHW